MGTESERSAEIEVFFDGGCPLCVREMNFLRGRDRNGRVQFTDIDDPGFQADVVGKSYGELMGQIHGRLPDGTWITGVEVFRRLYGAAGFGPVVGLTRLPVLSQLMDVAYRLFAKHRLRITGRCSKVACGLK